MMRSSLPISLGFAASPLLAAVDAVFLGQMGVDALAIGGYCTSVLFFMGAIGRHSTSSLAPLIAASLNHPLDQSRWIASGLGVSIILGVIFLAFMQLFALPLVALGLEARLQPAGLEFFRISTFSIIPTLIFYLLRHGLEARGRGKETMLLGFALVAIRAVANTAALSLGQGASAIAWGMVISEILGAFGAWWLARGAFETKLGQLSRLFSVHSAQEIWRIGFPTGLLAAAEYGAFLLVGVICAQTGALGMAAHSIALNLTALSFVFPMGIGQAAAIGIARCQNNTSRLNVIKSSSWLAFALSLILGIIIFLGRHRIPQLYTSDSQVIALGSQLLVMVSLFQVADCMQTTVVGSLRGLFDTKIPALIHMVAWWVVCAPLAWGLGLAAGMGVTGAWLGLAAGMAFAALAQGLRLAHVIRRRGI